MEEFETFVKNIDLNLEFIFNKNVYLTVVISDFHAKLHNWQITASGSKRGAVNYHHKGLHLGCCSSLRPASDSHHQLVFPEFNLKAYYPLTNERRVWHYKYANTAQINNALASFN